MNALRPRKGLVENMLKIICAFLLQLSSPAVHAASGEDVVLKAMNDELARTMARLRIDNLDRPYFASYYVVDSTGYYCSAVFGALKSDESSLSRSAAVNLRVGSRDFDNSSYVGQDFDGYAPGTASLDEEEGYDALRFSLWYLTDGVYKKALEKYSQKEAYRKKKNIRELYGDLSVEKPETLYDDRKLPEPFDAAAWKETVRRLSAVFRKYPKIQGSDVSFSLDLYTMRFVNSEGTRFRTWRDSVYVEMNASVQTREGHKINDQKSLQWRSLAAIPAYEALEAETEAFAREMSYLVESSTAEVYIGPVLFEGQASAEFLNQLFAANVSYPRTPWADNEDWTRYYIASGGLTKKLNMRVFPLFISVLDDPLRTSYEGVQLKGSYLIDNEGVRPAPLELVKNGKLVSFYMDRSPVKEFRRSNGHARGSLSEFPSPRPGNLFFSVLPEKRVPAGELKKKLFQAAADAGLDYAIIVRKLKTEIEKKSTQDLLAPPVLAYKVSLKDGSETLISGAEWSGVTFRALRDILLVSDSDFVYNYSQAGPFYWNRGWAHASIIAPSAMLVQEMELKPAENKPDRQPYLPHPFFAK